MLSRWTARDDLDILSGGYRTFLESGLIPTEFSVDEFQAFSVSDIRIENSVYRISGRSIVYDLVIKCNRRENSNFKVYIFL